jgi:hypothetical protein
MTICKTTGAAISYSEMHYREGKKNELLRRLQLQLGKTRSQVIELFRFYNKSRKTLIDPVTIPLRTV